MTDNANARPAEHDGLEYIERPALDFTVEMLSTLPEETRATLIEQLAQTLERTMRERLAYRLLKPATPNGQ